MNRKRWESLHELLLLACSFAKYGVVDGDDGANPESLASSLAQSPIGTVSRATPGVQAVPAAVVIPVVVVVLEVCQIPVAAQAPLSTAVFAPLHHPLVTVRVHACTARRA